MYARIRNFIIGWTEIYENKEDEAVQSIVNHFIEQGYEEEKIRSYLE